MNYFPATIGSEKVTIDGEKVRDKMELVSQNVNTLACGKMPANGGSPVVWNNEIYLLTTKLYKWDGTTWTEISALPSGFSSPPTVVYDGEIHILGGSTLSITKHYKWNGATWTSVSTLPYNFMFGGVVVLNNEIHLLGGTYSGVQRNHYKWNGTTWVSVSTLPYDFYDSQAVVLNDEIHLLGGNGGGSTHYKWDGSSWTRETNIPYRFVSGSAVVLNDEIHVFGGTETAGSDPKNPYRHAKFTNGSWTWLDYILFSYWNNNDSNATVYNKGITNSSAVVVLNGEFHVLAVNVNREYYILNSKIYRQGS